MGWLFDLTDERGPIFAVFRREAQEATAALAEHLVDAGTVADMQHAADLIWHVEPVAVAVVW